MRELQERCPDERGTYTRYIMYTLRPSCPTAQIVALGGKRAGPMVTTQGPP
jgi:hypothetical protein